MRRPCRIVRLTRRPWAYNSSHTLEEVDVRLDDGRELALVLKDPGWDTMLKAARLARPAFLYEPRREIQAYRHVLRRRVLGTPLCYGVFAETPQDRSWLVLERVAGLQLRHVDAFATWQSVASWLGRFHRRFERPSRQLGSDPRLRLIRYDADFMWLWMERARRAVERGSPRGRAARVEAIAWLARRYGRCVDTLAALPPTLIHGEFFASNVIVQPGGRHPRICPVDWETIATGPGLVDLAALASGNWTDLQRGDLLRAYHSALTGDAPPRGRTPDAVRAAFEFSQLHLAIRMVGWSADRPWRPPGDHAQDWLKEATRLGRTLKL